MSDPLAARVHALIAQWQAGHEPPTDDHHFNSGYWTGRQDCAAELEDEAALAAARANTVTVEDIACYVEHLRDEYVSSLVPVGKVARLIRERFGSAAAAAPRPKI